VIFLYYRKSLGILFVFIGVILLLDCCGLVDNNESNQEEPFDWAITPNIQFVSADWAYKADIYSIGDTICVGFVDHFRDFDSASDTTAIQRVTHCTISTASGDAEILTIFEHYLPGFWLSETIAVGGTIVPVASNDINQYNGILEITSNTTIYVNYIQPLYQPPNTTLKLSSRARIKGG